MRALHYVVLLPVSPGFGSDMTPITEWLAIVCQDIIERPRKDRSSVLLSGPGLGHQKKLHGANKGQGGIENCHKDGRVPFRFQSSPTGKEDADIGDHMGSRLRTKHRACRPVEAGVDSIANSPSHPEWPRGSLQRAIRGRLVLRGSRARGSLNPR